MTQMTDVSNCSDAWYTCSVPSLPNGHAGVKTAVADDTSAKTNDSAGSFDKLEWTRREIQ